jgi:hypothetical protein
MVERKEFESLTSCVQGRRSSQLSYRPDNHYILCDVRSLRSAMDFESYL